MMKKEKNFLFVSACLACFMFPLTARAKGVEAVSLGAGASYTNFSGKNFPGMYLGLRFFPHEKWSTGINVSAYGRKMDNSFGQVTNPKLDYSEVSWVNQYDILKKGRWAIGLNILNGLSVSRLANKGEQEKYRTSYGYRNRAKTIARDYFYILQPGMDISLRLLSPKHTPQLYLIAQASYRRAFGSGSFSDAADYAGYTFGVGIIIKRVFDHKN